MTRRDVLCLALGAIGIVVVGIIGSAVWPVTSTWLVAGVGVMGLLAVQLAVFRRTKATQETAAKRLRDDVQRMERQLEALASLCAVLQPSLPLPPFGGWSVTSEVGRLLVTLILERQPRLVLECGSGVSTLLSAYALRRLGRGRIVSLDHDQRYVERTRALLAAHGLAEWAEVVHAPLVPVTIGDRTWQWYDITRLRGVDQIDLCCVDGPPGSLQEQSRYPAVPLLVDRLAPDAAILLDDADRRDEQAIVRRWLGDVVGLEVVEETASRKGMVLRRQGAPAATSWPATRGATVGAGVKGRAW